jgi:hypothetical protein
MAISTRKESVEIDVVEMEQGELRLNILGRTPIVFNRMAVKAQRELLLPRGGRLTAAEKAANLKHDPLAEFRDSIYRRRDEEAGPTLLQFPSPGIKKAMASAALDTPSGVAKAKIGRLTWAEGYRVDIYGIPRLFMAVVRMADAAKTPDIRTRAIVEEWCLEVTFNFMKPVVTPHVISTLMTTAGRIIGIGDFRQEKGAGNFGQFNLVLDGNADFERIKATGGRVAQVAAMAEAVPFDADSEDMLAWFQSERQRRAA